MIVVIILRRRRGRGLLLLLLRRRPPPPLLLLLLLIILIVVQRQGKNWGLNQGFFLESPSRSRRCWSPFAELFWSGLETIQRGVALARGVVKPPRDSPISGFSMVWNQCGIFGTLKFLDVLWVLYSFVRKNVTHISGPLKIESSLAFCCGGFVLNRRVAVGRMPVKKQRSNLSLSSCRRSFYRSFEESDVRVTYKLHYNLQCMWSCRQNIAMQLSQILQRCKVAPRFVRGHHDHRGCDRFEKRTALVACGKGIFFLTNIATW